MHDERVERQPVDLPHALLTSLHREWFNRH
jgi:hypothetical protein